MAARALKASELVAARAQKAADAEKKAAKKAAGGTPYPRKVKPKPSHSGYI